MRGKEERKKIDKKTLVMKVQEPSTRVFFKFERVETCGDKILQKRERGISTNHQVCRKTTKVYSF
jgi:hypothetical protein